MPHAWTHNAWRPDAWAVDAWRSDGGQVVDVFQGFVSSSRTVALIGQSVSCEQETIHASLSGRGQEATVLQGTVASLLEVPLVGSFITAAPSSLFAENIQPALVGQEISSLLGNVTAQGDAVTVHLSGQDFVTQQGFLNGGVVFPTGQEISSLQGAFTKDLVLPIFGEGMDCLMGIIGPTQDADDTFISSVTGITSVLQSIPLVGSVMESVQGTVIPTSDSNVALIGVGATVEQGAVEANKQFLLIGLQFQAEQQSVGAPGGATLSGLGIQVEDGSVFTTGDRDFALTGLAATTETGITFASSLAFFPGLEISVSQGDIGPRTVGLLGQGVEVLTGLVGARGGDGHHGGDDCPKKRKKKRRRFLSDREFYRVAFEQLDSTKKPEAVAKALEQELIKKSVPIAKALLTAAETTVPAAQLEAKREAAIQKALYKRAAELAQEEAEVIKVLFS